MKFVTHVQQVMHSREVEPAAIVFNRADNLVFLREMDPILQKRERMSLMPPWPTFDGVPTVSSDRIQHSHVLFADGEVVRIPPW
jgi:hypothetical protein